MGGKQGGEIASATVIKAIFEYFSEAVRKGIKHEDLKDTLNKGFITAQTAVADIVAQHKELKGMGTTLAVMLIHESRYVWGSIGDSRIYILSKGFLKLSTEDHTFIAEYQKKNREPIPPRILAQYGNIVTKAVDGGTERADLYPAGKESNELLEGDLFIICSDGLIINKASDMVDILIDLLGKKPVSGKIPRKLVKWALKNGSEDNISVVAANYGTPFPASKHEDSKEPDEASKTVRIEIDNVAESG